MGALEILILVGRAQLPIDQFLQIKRVRRLLDKRDGGHIVGRSVKRMHDVKQALVLVVGGCKFQEHRLFHNKSLSSMKENVKKQGLKPDTPDHGR